MIRVVFAEWRKLRRPTLFLGTLGAALFFTGLTNSFLYLMIDHLWLKDISIINF